MRDPGQATSPGRRSARPYVTLGLVAASVALSGVAVLEELFRFQRDAIEAGELWRLLTGHLVHGTARLAVVDLALLLILGAWVENRSRRLFLVTLFASAALSSLCIWVWTSYAIYVGSSALSAGLFAAALVGVIRASRSRRELGGWSFVAACFIAKLALESLDRWPRALSPLPAGVELSSAAHVSGALAGLVVALVHYSRIHAGGSRSA